MKKSIVRPASILALTAAILAAPALSKAGDSSSSATVTNLPEIDLSGFQVSGLNNAGDLTGFFYVAFDHPPHAFVYTNGSLTDLGTLGGDIGQGNAINSHGQVVGESEPDGSFTSHAFFYDGTNMTDIGTLGGSYSSAGLINDNGQGAGSSLTSGDAETHAFLFSNNTMTDLGTMGGTYSSASALNSSGAVAGQSTLANNDLHAFLYSGGIMNNLGTLGGRYSAAFGLNDSGVVVGESTINDFVIHPFLFANGAMIDLGGFGGSYASAMSINNHNQVLGLSSFPGDAFYHGFVFANGQLTDLGTLGGDNTFPYAQNNLGQVVGQSDTATDGAHAFLWQNGSITDLNTLLPTNSGWTLQFALHINDTGRIIGIGDHNGLSEWFILDVGSASGNNNPPVAVPGASQVVDCQTPVTLDGSHSSDPDGDALSFAWTSAGFLLGTNPVINGAFALGTNVVTLTVTDPSGASNSANVTVTVLDTNAPVISVLNSVTLSAGANCSALLPVVFSQVTVSDNCTPVESIVLSQSPIAGTSLSLGQHTVTVTATDLSGNSSTAAVLVTVADTTAPVIVSGPAVAPVSAGQSCQGLTPDVTAGIHATDNCTPAAALVITQSPAAGTPASLGSHSIVVTVKDAAGNASTGFLDFTVVDTTAPVIASAPSVVTVSVGANCHGVVPNLLGSVVAVDNCTPASQLVMSQSVAAGSVLGKGTYPVTITVADLAGNVTSRPVLLNLVDTTAPVITSVTASPNTISSPNNKMVPVSLSVNASDNCDAPLNKIISIACNESVAPGDMQITGNLTASVLASRDSNGTGRVYTITVQSSDSSGNSSLATVTVTVPKGKK
jgi:probable HAF family extracellular repeat protein